MHIANIVKERVELLNSFHELGREGRVKGTRELVFAEFPYIIPYRIKNGNIEILRFFHAKRQIPQNWQ